MIHYYILSAVLEISGCYYFYKGNYLVAVPLLVLFAYTLGMQPYEPARAYVIYGGIYIVCSLIFAVMTGVALEIRDWVGVVLLLSGVLILL